MDRSVVCMISGAMPKRGRQHLALVYSSRALYSLYSSH